MSPSIIAMLLLLSGGIHAQELALAPAKVDCPTQEPDSVQISWTAPCENGDWLLDTELGCRMWDWHPDPNDKAVWSGTCPSGLKEGRGVVQWYEHGQPIDRFEGTFRGGKREGFGRYRWNEKNVFEGGYANDVPHGFGTASVAGETFAGRWTNGCMRRADKVVAIGVPRLSCTAGPSATRNRRQAPSF